MAKVLVIDDDPDLRHTLERTLTLSGHDVLEAGDGNEGLRVLHSQPVDLVLCDIFMPDKEGIETITEISRDFPGITIIAMSGGNPSSNPMLSIVSMLGDVRILEKPFDTKTLLSTVEEAVH